MAAIDGVLAIRGEVVDPMWDSQQFLGEQIADVRGRLARAVVAADEAADGADAQIDNQSAARLDRLAAEIASEQDPVRKKKLVMRYQSFRDLARVKALKDRLTPNQRKLWGNVLRVLDEVSLAHQQMIVSSEVLFRQPRDDPTRTSRTTCSSCGRWTAPAACSACSAAARGAPAGDMTGFAENMVQLQRRLESFNTSVEGALGGRMIELEAELDAMPAGERALGGGTYGEVDDELADRINRVTTPGAQ